MKLLIKTKSLLPQLILAVLFKTFGFIAPKTLTYLSFQSLDFERTWWGLFQIRVLRTKFDIYVFICNNLYQTIAGNVQYHPRRQTVSTKV